MDFRFGLVVLLCLLGFTHGSQVPYKDCYEHKIGGLAIDCPTEENICILKKGRSYSINVTFVSDSDSVTSTTVVKGIIAGVPVPFPMDHPEACNSSISCPIHKMQRYNYNTNLPVKEIYPAIKLTVMWKLVNDDSKDLFCIEFPVEIRG